MSTERDRRVREQAYHLWEADGRKPGRSDEYWAKAEGEIGGAASARAGKSKAAPAPKDAVGKAKEPAAEPVTAKPVTAKPAKVAAATESSGRRSPAKASPAAKT